MKLKYSGILILIFIAVAVISNTYVLAERAFTKKSLPPITGIDKYSYWYAEYLKGIKVGYTHDTRTTDVVDGREAIKSTKESLVKIKRVDSIIEAKEKTEYYESKGGKPLKFIHESTTGEKGATKLEGIFNGDNLEIISTNYGNSYKSEQILSGTILFPYMVDKLYQRNAGSSFNYKTIVPNLGAKVVKAKVDFLQTAPTNILGNTVDLHKYEVTYDAFPSVLTYEWRDNKGVIYKSTSSMMKASTYLTTEEEATIIDTRKQVDIIIDNIILTDTAIPDPRDTKFASFKAKTKIGSLKDVFLKDPRQEIKKESYDEIQLDVSAYLPGYLLYNYPFDDPLMKAYLRDNNYIQPSNPLIKTKALEVVKNQKNAFIAAKSLEKWVNKAISNKNYNTGMASATEVMETKQGDCSEHAVLLASLCRSIGIPAQVVAGIVYMPIPGSEKGSFVYHMWTEVFVGKWIQLDATMPNDGVADATHLTMLKSTLNNPEEVGNLSTLVLNVIGNLEIDVVNYTSDFSGKFNIENQISETKEYNLEDLIASGMDNYNVPLQSINLDTFKDKEKVIDKFNITNLPNTSPILETYEGYFTKGMAVYAKGETDKSKLYFQKAADLIYEKDAKGYYDLGVKLAGIMMFTLAQEQFDKAIALNDDLWSRKANTFMEEKLPKGVYNAKSEKYNMDGFSFVNFANNYPAALLMYKKAIDESPQFDSPLYNIGVIYNVQGEPQEAIASFNKALSINPGNALIYAGLGSAYQESLQLDKAILNYQKAVQLGDKRDSIFVNEINYRIALIKASELLQKNPNDTNAFLLLGRAALNNEQYKQAKLAFLKVLNTNQKIASAHEGLGQTFLHLGKPLYAEDEFNKALQLNSRLVEAYIGLGIINQRRFDYNKAISYYRKAASLNNRAYDAYIHLGNAYLEMGNVKQAINEFSKANNAEGYYWLGFSYLINNDLQQSKAYFKKSININPFDARPYKDLARIYLQEEELLETRNLLDNAIGLDTNYSDAYFLLGLLDELESNKISAARNYVLAYTIDPTSISAYKKAYAIFKDENELDKFNIPRPKFVPDTAEREFLIRILYLEGLHIKAATHYLNKMLSNCRFGFLAIPKDYIGMQTIEQVCSHYLSTLKGLYREVSELEAPPRFVSIKDAFLEYLWSDANFINKELVYIKLGIYPNNAKSVDVLNTVDTAKNEIALTKNSFYNLLSTLKQKCDPISYDELTSYSGFDDKDWGIYNEKFKAIEERTQQALAVITPKSE